MTEMTDMTEMNNLKDRTCGPRFVRACKIEMQSNISQEPLHTEIYRKNAAPQNEPRTRTHILCEPAQSKRMSRFYTRRFIQKFTGNRQQKRVSTLIKHQASHLLLETLSVDTPFGEECFYILAAKKNPTFNLTFYLAYIFSLTHVLLLSRTLSTIFNILSNISAICLTCMRSYYHIFLLRFLTAYRILISVTK